jgi:hypothetical protein
MGDWVELAKALATGVGAAVPILGTLGFFHKQRGARLVSLEGKVDKIDTDFDGLTKQLGGIVNDVEKRFLTREEGTAAINRLDSTCVELNRSIRDLTSHLLDVARDHPRSQS